MHGFVFQWGGAIEKTKDKLFVFVFVFVFVWNSDARVGGNQARVPNLKSEVEISTEVWELSQASSRAWKLDVVGSSIELWELDSGLDKMVGARQTSNQSWKHTLLWRVQGYVPLKSTCLSLVWELGWSSMFPFLDYGAKVPSSSSYLHSHIVGG